MFGLRRKKKKTSIIPDASKVTVNSIFSQNEKTKAKIEKKKIKEEPHFFSKDHKKSNEIESKKKVEKLVKVSKEKKGIDMSLYKTGFEAWLEVEIHKLSIFEREGCGCMVCKGSLSDLDLLRLVKKKYEQDKAV